MDYFSNFQIIARKKHGKKHFSSLYYIDVVFLVRFNICVVCLKNLAFLHPCILAKAHMGGRRWANYYYIII